MMQILQKKMVLYLEKLTLDVLKISIILLN